MKYFCLFLLVFPYLSIAQVTLNWSDTMVVNRFNANAHTRPKIALTENEVPVVMWGQIPNQRVFVSRLDGNSFAPPSLITPTNVNAFVQDWAGPDMSSSGDNVFVVFKSQPENDGFIYSVKSVDGGVAFADTVRVYPSNFSRFPAVAVAPDGKPHVTFMTFDSGWGNAQYAVATSDDGGETYGAKVEASSVAPGYVCDCCPGFIGADTDNFVYSMFRNNDNNLRDIWAAVSTNGGENFSAGGDIDNSNWIINGCPSTGPDAYINGDSIVTVWMSGARGSSRIYLGTTHKNTLEIGINEMLSPGLPSSANQNYPKVAGSRDTIGISWQESQQGSTVIKFIYSVTGPAGIFGQTPETISLNFSGAQKNPDMSYSNGTFHFVWQDDNKKAVTYRSATISNTTGLEFSPKDKPYAVFPNPTTRDLNITIRDQVLHKNAWISLVDWTGKIVYSKPINSEREVISNDSIPAGIYILHIEGLNQSYREKIIFLK
jgi:hypothetical protein